MPPASIAQGAEDFRRLKEQEREAQRPGQGAGKKRHRGIAFGSGGAARQRVNHGSGQAGGQGGGADGRPCDVHWLLVLCPCLHCPVLPGTARYCLLQVYWMRMMATASWMTM